MDDYKVYFLFLVCLQVAGGQLSSSCIKKEKVSLLLDIANGFISKARDSRPQCLSAYSTTTDAAETSTTLMNAAKTVILAAKNEFLTKSSSSKYKLVCYFESLAYSRRGEAKFDISSFVPELCTHAIYGVADLLDNRIVPLDPIIDLPESLKGYQQFNDLKLKNPKLKTLISFGGWVENGSLPYSLMAETQERRSVFVKSVVEFLDQHGFDGIDIHWGYPVTNGGRPQDKQNYVLLLKELKAALQPRGYLLTADVSADVAEIDAAYNIPEISKVLDQIHLWSYAFHGAWEGFTGSNAPLYASPDTSEENKAATVSFAVDYWLERGAPKDKLVLTLPFFGHSYTLANFLENEIQAPTTGIGKPGFFNGEPGELGFNEVCENLTKKRWASVWDPDTQTPYAFKNNQWVSYDDQKSINAKVDYLIKKGLAGALVRSIDTDDHKGRCYGKKYLLLRSVAKRLLA